MYRKVRSFNGSVQRRNALISTASACTPELIHKELQHLRESVVCAPWVKTSPRLAATGVDGDAGALGRGRRQPCAALCHRENSEHLVAGSTSNW